MEDKLQMKSCDCSALMLIDLDEEGCELDVHVQMQELMDGWMDGQTFTEKKRVHPKHEIGCRDLRSI